MYRFLASMLLPVARLYARVLLACLAWLLGGFVSAQLPLTRVSGLSQNTVYAITQDDLGFLWLGTGNGINRFDGHEVMSFLPSDSGLAGRFIRNGFLQDARGNLWFASENGTQYLERKTGRIKTPYCHIQGKRLPVHGTFPLLCERNHIWLVNESSGLFAYDPETERAVSYGLPQAAGSALPVQVKGVDDRFGRFWFATQQGVACFDRSSKRWSVHLTKQSVQAVAMMGDTLLAAVGHQLFSLAPQANRFLSYPLPSCSHPGMITTLYAHRPDSCWIGDDQGNLFFLSNRFSARWIGNINPAQENVSRFPIYALFQSRDGSLWIGADVLGLSYMPTRESAFRVYGKQQKGSAGYFIQSILPVSDDEVWLGVYQRGIQSLHLPTGRIRPAAEIPAGSSANPNYPLLHQEKTGAQWIFAHGALYYRTARKDRWQLVPLTVPPKLLTPSGMVTPNAIVTDTAGAWLATSIGLYRLSKRGNKIVAFHHPEVGYTNITTLWQHPTSNKLWLGLETGGIAVVETSLQPLTYRRLPAQQRNSISHFSYHADHPDWLWVASLNGLLCLHLPTEQFRLYNEKHGLPSTYLHAAVQAESSIWVTSSGGLSRSDYKKQTGNNLFPELTFELMGTEYGVSTQGFGSGVYYFQRGQPMMFGTSDGLMVFHPDSLTLHPIEWPVRITRIQVNELPLSDSLMPEWKREIDLLWHQNDLVLGFTAIAFADAMQVQYRHRLVGWDKDWIYSGNLREVRYNRLPPGRYEFEVAARLSGQPWGQPTRLSIYIEPPFWRKRWFYIPVILLVLLAAIWVVRYWSQRKLLRAIARLEREQALEIERQRISREMHDDIGAGLTQITWMSEDLAQQLSGEKAKQIAGISRKLVGNMSEIIWSLNQENSNLESLFAYMREQLTNLVEEHPIQLSINLPEQHNNPTLDFKHKRNLLLLTKEAVHNAIKHSGCTKIEVGGSCSENRLDLWVIDNGSGFDRSKPYRGNGLRNMQARSQALGIEQVIETGLGKGTAIRWQWSLPRGR